jgi:hypothetical protein
MATKKNTGGDDTVDHSKSVDDHSEDVTVTVGSDTTTEVGDVTVQHWDHPKTHSGPYRIDRGDRVIKYAHPSSVDESG